mgnify:CR=1 FL=1
MLNISGIREGVVLDHIQAGKSMDIYRYLRLGELDCTVAIIKNAKSNKMGRKDIIKIEGSLDAIDLDVLATSTTTSPSTSSAMTRSPRSVPCIFRRS